MMMKSSKVEKFKRGILLYATFLALYLLLFTSCKQEDETIASQPQPYGVECTVAVVAPIGDAATKLRLERTAQWFADNFHEAQQYDSLHVTLKIDWYDELSDDMAALSRRLANDTTVKAVIGPFANENLALFAPACYKTRKPLIAPTATSEEIVRRYAIPTLFGMNTYEGGFLWTLTETDARCVETMMTLYRSWLGKHPYELGVSPSVACFSPADQYGQTFFDWAPFHAHNLGIRLTRNEQYADGSDLLSCMNNYLQYQNKEEEVATSLLSSNLCVVESTRQLCDVVRLRRKMLIEDYRMKEADGDASWDDVSYDHYWELFESFFRTWFVFSNLSEEAIAALDARDKAMLQGYQGFSPYADPATGFEKAYTEKFGSMPTFAECKFYDALLLAGLGSRLLLTLDKRDFAVGDAKISMNQLFNYCLFVIGGEHVETTNAADAIWQIAAMRNYIGSLRAMVGLKRFCGASGHIVFDAETSTQIAKTTYVHWQLTDGKIYHRTYFGPNGQLEVSPSASWSFFYDEDTANKDFSEMAEDVMPAISYPALTEQYAVLVQGSDGSTNYRHLADVLSVYQLLRKGGFDDDHIVLILDKQEAARQDNIIRSSFISDDLMGGTDGLPGAVVDYDNHALTAAEVADILKKVSGSVAGANILLYWSGHGRSQSNGGSNEFEWLGTSAGQGFTADLLRQTASEMLAEGGARKLLVIAEPCYAEATVSSLVGITGALAFVGANTAEQSWGDNWNSEGLYWMSDRFTQNVVKQLTDNPAITYRDLFLYCAQHTLGSHARIVNVEHFGNLYTDSPQEFFVKMKSEK